MAHDRGHHRHDRAATRQGNRLSARATALRRALAGHRERRLLARIKLLAERNGIPLAQLLGDRHAKLIEAAAIDVTPMADDEQY